MAILRWRCLPLLLIILFCSSVRIRPGQDKAAARESNDAVGDRAGMWFPVTGVGASSIESLVECNKTSIVAPTGDWHDDIWERFALCEVYTGVVEFFFTQRVI